VAVTAQGWGTKINIETAPTQRKSGTFCLPTGDETPRQAGDGGWSARDGNHDRTGHLDGGSRAWRATPDGSTSNADSTQIATVEIVSADTGGRAPAAHPVTRGRRINVFQYPTRRYEYVFTRYRSPSITVQPMGPTVGFSWPHRR